jgi:quercetin dioxygenase-like cupin family protein
MTGCKADFNSLPWQPSQLGARSKVFQQGSRVLRLVEFTSEFVEEAWCKKGHMGYVLQGEMDLQFDRETVHFSAGDGLFIPGGEKSRHKASVPSGRVTLILVEEV